MWKSACVGIHQLLNWKMHSEILKFLIPAIRKKFFKGCWIAFKKLRYNSDSVHNPKISNTTLDKIVLFKET